MPTIQVFSHLTVYLMKGKNIRLETVCHAF